MVCQVFPWTNRKYNLRFNSEYRRENGEVNDSMVQVLTLMRYSKHTHSIVVCDKWWSGDNIGEKWRRSARAARRVRRLCQRALYAEEPHRQLRDWQVNRPCPGRGASWRSDSAIKYESYVTTHAHRSRLTAEFRPSLTGVIATRRPVCSRATWRYIIRLIISIKNS